MRRPFRRILSLLLIALLIYGGYQYGSLTARSAVDAKYEGVSRSAGEVADALPSEAAEAQEAQANRSALAALSAAIAPGEAPGAAPTATTAAAMRATPTPAPTATPAPTLAPLSRGSKGAEVEALQRRLNELGYSVGAVDGQFGGKTEAAVRAFQAAAGLSATGIADGATQALLYSAEALALMPTATPRPTAAPERERSSEPMVWIPRTGKRYHSNERCSNMKNPSHVTLSEAKRRGFTPCKKCY